MTISNLKFEISNLRFPILSMPRGEAQFVFPGYR